MSLSTPAKAPRTGREGLRHLLGAFDVDMFLNEYLGENMLHLTEDRGRWGELFSWDDLNRLLNRDAAAPPPYLRLVRHGQVVKSSSYSHERGGLTTIDPARCQRLMAEGATLIVQLPEGLSPALDTLMASLKRDLNAPAYADIVVTSASVPGLKMHWDPYRGAQHPARGMQGMAGLQTRPAISPARDKVLPGAQRPRGTQSTHGPADLDGPDAPRRSDLSAARVVARRDAADRAVHAPEHRGRHSDDQRFHRLVRAVAQGEGGRQTAAPVLECHRMSAMADRARELAAATIDAGTLEAFLADATDQRRPTAPFALPSAGLAKASAISLTGTTRVQLRQPPLQDPDPGRIAASRGGRRHAGIHRARHAGRAAFERSGVVHARRADGRVRSAAGEGHFVLSLIAGGLANIVEET